MDAVVDKLPRSLEGQRPAHHRRVRGSNHIQEPLGRKLSRHQMREGVSCTTWARLQGRRINELNRTALSRCPEGATATSEAEGVNPCRNNEQSERPRHIVNYQIQCRGLLIIDSSKDLFCLSRLSNFATSI